MGRSRCEPSLLLNEQFTAGMGIGFPLILIGSVLAASVGRPAAPAVADAPDRLAASGASGT